mgnify:CR=1 FL=1
MKQMKYKKQIQLIAAIVTLIVFPVITFYLMEAYTHNPFEEVRPWAQFFNILLFELLAWIFVSVTGKIQSGLRIELVTAMIYGIANAYVVRFRTNPIVPWDIFSWKTAASVASNYDFKPDIRMIVVTLAFLGMIVLLQFVKTGMPKFQLWKRLIPAGACCIVLVLFVNLLQDEDFQTGHRLYPFLFTPAFMTQVNGVAVTFAMDLAYMTVEKPAGYDAVKEQALLESYAGQEDDTDSSEKKEELPNIIVVMNESFSDLNVLGDFTTNEDYMPYLHSLQNGAVNTVTGYLNVSVCGGNTANTEFEFLTGNSMAFLPQGSIPYQQYITKELPALPAYLASLGYETVATHPYYADGWDRDKVYPLFGFQETHFLPDYKNPVLVRDYVSDKSDFDKIIESFEQKEEGQPLFLFNVTMQNHSSYTESFDNFHPDIKVEGTDSAALNNYLSLMKLSDEALQELITYFEGQDEETIIVFFGDHQPTNSVVEPVWKLNGKRNSTLTEEEVSRRYKVPFIIWANYEIEGAQNVETSANYLGSKTLQAAGLPLPAYFSYLTAFSQEVPVISANHVDLKDGTFTNAEEQESLLSQYKGYQYYQLFDSSDN